MRLGGIYAKWTLRPPTAAVAAARGNDRRRHRTHTCYCCLKWPRKELIKRWIFEKLSRIFLLFNIGSLKTLFAFDIIVLLLSTTLNVCIIILHNIIYCGQLKNVMLPCSMLPWSMIHEGWWWILCLCTCWILAVFVLCVFDESVFSSYYILICFFVCFRVKK